MKILVYAHHLDVGGSQVNAIELAAALRDLHGFDVVLFAAPGAMVKLVEEKGLRFVAAPDARCHPSPARIKALRDLVRRESPDLIHVWDWWQTLDAYYAIHLLMKIPMVVSDMTMNVTRLLPKHLPTTFGIPRLVDQARAAGRPNVELILPPVDVQLNAPGAVDTAEFRKLCAIEKGDIVLVTVSRLVAWMKRESLLGTMEAVRTLGRDLPLRFVIVGDGHDRPSLQKRAEEVNGELGRSAIVLTGALFDPRPAYAAADIVVAMGGAALRGMAFGKPVIVVGEQGFSLRLNTDTAESLYYNGIYGQGDGISGNAGLISDIRELAQHPDRLPSLGEFSRQFVLQHFSLETVSARLAALCRTAAAERFRLSTALGDGLRTGAVYLKERRFLIPSQYPQSVETVDNRTPSAPLSQRYAIITPARDEEKHIEATFQSVIAQSILPERWVIVNDGSSDRTGVIAERYAREHSWITVVHRADRGARKNGAGVVEAFGDGKRRLEGVDWDFIVKLDGDLSFPHDYFERCFQEFHRDSTLGIGGGALYNLGGNGPQFEPHPWFHVRGATKIYRRSCWEQIGGLWLGPGWDTIDEIKANMRGWRTRTFADIHAYHHRMTGAADGGWRDNAKNGRGNYVAGYHPLYVLARCVHRIRRKPYVVGGIAMLYGYLAAHWERIRQIDDPQMIRYIRRQQINRLMGRPTVWK